jgi:hypothetical protein
MTQIDAINRMLRYIGELPIPSTVVIDDLPEGHEAIQARTILEETLREEQEEKWWFNSFTRSYLPNLSGYITVPSNIISIDSKKGQYRTEGNDLYDVTNDTKHFTQPVELDVLLEVQFDDIPDVFRTYVVLQAAKHLHTYLNADETTQKELSIKTQLQRIKLEREHLKQSKFNLARGTRLLDRSTNPSALS